MFLQEKFIQIIYTEYRINVLYRDTDFPQDKIYFM